MGYPPQGLKTLGFMEFWSDPPLYGLAITTVPQNLSLPDVVVSGIPANATVIRVVACILADSKEDSSAAINYLNADANIRMIPPGGIGKGCVAISCALLQWITNASAKEGGITQWGNADLSDYFTGDGTYQFRSLEVDVGDGLIALGTSLLLYDVKMGLRVYFTS